MFRAIVMLVFLGAAAASHAQVVDARATTLLTGRQEPIDGRGRTAVTAYELVTVRATGLGAPGLDDLQLHVQGWGALDAAALREGRRVSGDLELAYAQGATLERRLQVRLGRHIVVGGATRPTQVDGLSASMDVWKGIGLAGFGGVRVLPRFAGGAGELLGGARAFWRRSFDTQLGASFVTVRERGATIREDVGLDGRWLARRDLALAAYALWALEGRLAEAQALASWQPTRALELIVNAKRTAPDLFLPRSSILWVFSDESHDELGGEVNWAFRKWLGLRGEGQAISSAEGTGFRAGVRGEGRLGPSRRTLVGAEARRLDLPRGGYSHGRLFGSHRHGRFAATGDLDLYRLDEPVNGYDRSFTATGTLGVDVARGWRVMVAALGGVTPFLEQRFDVTARVAYTHGAPWGEVAP